MADGFAPGDWVMSVNGASTHLRLRNSAKAIIIQDGAVLLCRCVDEDGDWYVLPGGGQQPGETLIEAVQRECMEETGLAVQVGELRFVREYIGSRHDFPNFARNEHQIEFMFECSVQTLRPDLTSVSAVDRGAPAPGLGQGALGDDHLGPALGHLPDAHQSGVDWMPLSRLSQIRLHPVPLRTLLAQPLVQGVIYLGAVL